MIRLFIDSSIDNCGYAVADDERILASGVVKTKGRGMDRLLSLSKGIKGVIGRREYDMPAKAIVEIPAGFSYRRHTSRETGKGMNHIGLRSLNWAIGAIVLTLLEYGIEIETIEAHKWKGRTAKGVLMQIAPNYIGRAVADHNEADAIGLAIYWNNGRLKLKQQPSHGRIACSTESF